MPSDPKNHDWPQPDERDAPPPIADEDVLNLGDELAAFFRTRQGDGTATFIDLMSRSFEHSPAIARTMRHLLQLLRHVEEDPASFMSAATGNPGRFRRMVALMGHSDWLGRWLSAGVWKEWLAAGDSPDLTGEAMLLRLSAPAPEEGTAPLSLDAFVRHLQFAHAFLMCEIAAADMLDGASLESTVTRISDLADSSCQAAMDFAAASVAGKFGFMEPGDNGPFSVCVLAMGKLGGRELNYSSDIDLVFVLEGGERSTGGTRSLDPETYATRIAEVAIRCLADQGTLGPAYRVDTRLRPDGNSGPLVRTLSATVGYYHQRGATWERQALLKARPVAGNRGLGQRLLEQLQPFIHRRYLSARAISEIKALKHRIEIRTESRDDTYRDVKTGFGGIRDIEFVVQFLQLVNGGRMPSVRSPNTLDALHRLAEAGCLRHEEAEDMAASYRLLRRIEHGLQLDAGQQTHRIDDHPVRLAALAARLGYRDMPGQSAARQMYMELARATVRTRGLLLRLFTGLFRATPETAGIPDLALDPEVDAATAAQLLAPFGFTDVPRALNLIQRMSVESTAFRRFEPRTRTYFASSLPGLLAWAGETADPMAALASLDRLVSSLGAKGVFYELLAERPDILNEVGRLCTESGWMLGLIERRPGLMDQWLDGLRTGAAFNAETHRRELDARLAIMPPTEALQWSRDSAFLQVAAADLAGSLSPTGVWAALADIAANVLASAIDICIAAEEARQTDSSAKLPGELAGRICVLALGKLGGASLDYGSDLDIVIVADADGGDLAPFERVAQGVVRMLATEAGVYQVDLRLRPQGSRGAAASSLPSFLAHVGTGLAFWERLALARARIVHGADTAAGRAVQQAIDHARYAAPLPADAAAETLAMRIRQEREAGPYSVKRGPGGLADCDFGLALAQLVLGRTDEKCRTPDTFAAFEHCIRSAGQPAADALEVLRDAAIAQRRYTQRMKLRHGTTPSELGTPTAGSARQVATAGSRTSASFAAIPAPANSPVEQAEAEELNATRKRAREAFTSITEWAARHLSVTEGRD